MSRRSPHGLLVCAALAALLLVAAPPAAAVPPTNDDPFAAGVLSPFTAENGTPASLQAVAELAEARPDAGVPRCLGPRSFARTVWYRIPEYASRVLLTVEATGGTLDVVDLAAFVQAEVPVASSAAPRARTSQAALLTREPNQCGGTGAGGSDAAAEPSAAVTLLVPAYHPVLLQVGRRGAAARAAGEQALVTLEAAVAAALGAPRGDLAGSATPRLPGSGTTTVPLAGATLTGEDPAQPPCPSLGTVWRRFEPGATGRRVISVAGSAATTLAAFAGRVPTGDNVLDCVNREGKGALRMNVPVRRGRTVWVRIGTEVTRRAETARVQLSDGVGATVVDGGPGGFDPTSGGPGGGLPAVCDRVDVTRARLSRTRLSGSATARNRGRTVALAIRVRGASICDAELRLYGPGGGVYAKLLARRLGPGRQTVQLPRLRTIRAGRYRLEVRGVAPTGRRVVVPGTVSGRLGR
jgi:hypothetical protein